MANVRTISPEELAGQETYIQQVRRFYGIGDRRLLLLMFEPMDASRMYPILNT